MKPFSILQVLLCATCLVALPLNANAQNAQKTNVSAATGAVKAGNSTATLVGEMKSINAAYEDTLVHIGRKYGIGFVEMRAANPKLDPWIPGAGAEIVIPTQNLIPDAPHRGAIINLAEMRIYIFDKGANTTPKSFAIGIGRDGLQTPVGTTTIVRKAADPTWTPTPRMRAEDPTLPPVVFPGPDNPMGTHALYLGFPHIAIHGTNKPYGIGRRVSSGCIRMFPEDIGRVFDMLPVGTQVTVVDQPIKAGWVGNSFFIEASPTQTQATAMEKEGKIPEYEVSESDLAYIMRKAGNDQNLLDWAEVRKVIKERKGYPIEVATRSGGSNSEGAGVQDASLEENSVSTPPKPILKTNKPSV